MTDEVVIEVFQDEPVTALWCHQCSLPSGVRTTFHLGSPDSGTTKTLTRCEEDPGHVLIEDPA